MFCHCLNFVNFPLYFPFELYMHYFVLRFLHLPIEDLNHFVSNICICSMDNCLFLHGIINNFPLTGALFLVIVGSLAALSAASSIHHCLSCLSVAVLSSTLRKQPATAACLASPHSVTGFLVLNPTLHGLLWDKRKNFSWDSGGGGGVGWKIAIRVM